MNCSEHDLHQAHGLLAAATADADRRNAAATRAGASERDDEVERLIGGLAQCPGISAEMRTAVAFAIRCAYLMGYEQARADLRRAA